MSNKDVMWVVAIGSVADGHRFLGPFNTEEEADTWIEKQDRLTRAVCWVVEVKSIAFAERVITKALEEKYQ